MTWRAGALAIASLTLFLGASGATAQTRSTLTVEDDLVQLDFNEAELTDIIDMISKMTNKNFIYDERVRGTVTIKSPLRRLPGFTSKKWPGTVMT